MVLYYRHEESVSAMAAALELTEETARQRLVRGRAMLASRLDRILGHGLRASAPTGVFTMGVISALPMAAFSAKAGTLGAAIKGGASMKAAASTGMMASVLIGPIVGLLGAYAGYRNTMNQTIAPQERRLTRWCTAAILVVGIAFNVMLVFCKTWSRWLGLSNAAIAVVLISAIVLYAAMIVGFVIVFNARFRRLRAQLITAHPELAGKAEANCKRLTFEYRSRFTLRGFPIVHINTGAKSDGRPRAAVGWVAIGGKAYGLLFACGAIAIAPISFGGISLGLVTFGGLAAGVLVWGGVGIGAWTLGGLAVGVKAIGGCALAWSAAQGGVAVAHSYAEGGVALAQHANDSIAHAYFGSDLFFRFCNGMLPYANWLWLLFILPMIPVFSRLRSKAPRN